MFCPSCGSEERQASQFCRACGSDLRAVRLSLERPDSITASAVTARDEIGRAVAQKIREIEGARDLERVAEDVLPQIEKFLESYEEKRLRRMRAGVITSALGFGTCVVGLVMSSIMPGELASALTIGGAGAGFLMFLGGMGLVVNGVMLTRPRKGLEDRSPDAFLQELLDGANAPPQLNSNSPAPSSFRAGTTSDLSHAAGASVTEHTTLHLKRE